VSENPYDVILLEKRISTLRQRCIALEDAKSLVDSKLRSARVSYMAALDELVNQKQTKLGF